MNSQAFPVLRNPLAPAIAALALATAGLAFAQAPAPASADPSNAPRPVPMPMTMPMTMPGQPASAPDMARESHGRSAHADHGQRRTAPGEGYGGGMMGPKMLSGLNLSEAQRDRVFTILHTQAPAMREQAKQVRRARQDLQALSLSGELDESRLRAAAQRASQAMTDLAVLRARTHNEVFKVLTPEQQSQLRTRLEQRHQHHHGTRHS